MIAIVVMAFLLLSLMLVIAYAAVRSNMGTTYSDLMQQDDQIRQMIRNGQADDALARLYRLAARDNERVQQMVSEAIDAWRQAEQIIEQHPELRQDEMLYQALLTEDADAAHRRYMRLVGSKRSVRSHDVVKGLMQHRDIVYGHKERHPEESLSDAGIRDMLAAGRFDEAVRAYQLFTGVDQFTAQDAVTERWQQLRLSGEAEDNAAFDAEADDETTISIDEEGQLQRRGRTGNQ